MTSRRALLTGASAIALAAPLMAFGHKKERVWRIGHVGGDSPNCRFVRTFRDELRRLGYAEGETVAIDYRWPEGQPDRIPGFVQDLIKSKVDLLVAGNAVAIRAAQRETTTIPIVMSTSIDPVAAGFAQSLRRPGGNVTGLFHRNTDLCVKRIEILKGLIPSLLRLAILWDMNDLGPQVRFRKYLTVAKSLRMHTQSLEINSANPDFETAFRIALTNQAQAVIVIANPTLLYHRGTVLSLAMRHRLPTMVESAQYVEAGGLLGYSADWDEGATILAGMVGNVLKGARPKEFPIQQPAKFTLTINMETAKALGITIPSWIMLHADRVIS